jgi:hypothetical protein
MTDSISRALPDYDLRRCPVFLQTFTNGEYVCAVPVAFSEDSFKEPLQTCHAVYSRSRCPRRRPRNAVSVIRLYIDRFFGQQRWSAAVTIGGDADATEPAGKKPRKAEDMGLRLYLALAQWTGSRKVTANGGKEVVDVLVDKDERSSAERQRSTPHQKAFAVAHERYF